MPAWPDVEMAEATRAEGANLAVEEIASRLLREVSRQGIQMLLLRGPPLIRLLDLPAGARGSGDVDLLVAPRHADRAVNLLASLGYRRVSKPANDVSGAHADVWLRQPSAVTIDLHRTLIGVRAPSEELFTCLQETSVTMRVGVEKARVPAGPGLALVLVLHAAAHGCDGGKPLDDLRRGLEVLRRSDWDRAREFAELLDAVDAFEAGLGLVEMRKARRSPRVDVTLRARSAPHTALGFERLSHAPGLGGKARHALRTAFPPRSVLHGWHPVARRSPLGLAAAYVMRLVWLSRWAGPGFRAWLRAQRDTRSG